MSGCGLGKYGQLGNLNINNVSVPISISTVSNVIDIASGLKHSLMINNCSAKTSGPFCQYPVCYGISSFSQKACSSSGECVGPNTCICFSPSYGDSCQNNVYYWKQSTLPNPLWSSALNWNVKSGDLLIPTPNAPLEQGVAVNFEIPGASNTYPIMLDVKSLKLSKLIISPGFAGVTFISTFTNMTISEELILNSNSKFDIGGGTLSFPTSTHIYGNLNLKQTTVTGTLRSYLLSSISMENSYINSDLYIKGSIELKDSQVESKILDIYSTRIMFTRSTINFPVNSSITISGDLFYIFSSNFMSSKTVNLLLLSKQIISFSANLNNVTLSSTSDFFIGNCTLTSSSILVSKGLIQKGSFSSLLKNSTIKIQTNGVFNVFGSFETDSSSNMTNYGTLLIHSQNGTSISLGNIVNAQILRVQNEKINVTMSNVIIQNLTPLVKSKNSFENQNITFTNPQAIYDGEFYMSGILNCSSFDYYSPEAFTITAPSMTFSGNLTVGEKVTMFLKTNGTSLGSSTHIYIKGLFTSYGFLVIAKVTGSYKPKISDKIPMIYYNSFKKFGSFLTYFSGAPFQNLLPYESQNTVFFEVKSSAGATDLVGYDCSYLGNRRTLEINQFAKQNKIMLSFTTPTLDLNSKLIGFGFDNNRSKDLGTFLIKNGSNLEEYNHNPRIKIINYYDASAASELSVFDIGPYYTTFNVLVGKDFLQSSQNMIYYAEIEKGYHSYLENISIKAVVGNQIECTNFNQPTRAESLSPISLGIVLGVYLFFFILCLIFCRFRPMNTRGVSPFLTLMFIFTQLALEIKNHLPLPNFQQALCVYLGFGIFPLQQLCFIMIFLYFLRYFAIIGLNRNKKLVSEQISSGNNNVTKFIKFQIRFFKIASNPIITIVLIIIFYILLNILSTIVLGINRFLCSFKILLALKIINNILLITIYSLMIITFLIDMIANYNLIIKCRWIQYIFYTDPYWFRAQMFLFFPFLVYSLIVEIVIAVNSSSYAKVIDFYLKECILNTISALILLIIDVILPLLITIIELIKTCFKKKSKDGLTDVLLNPETESLFYKFCESEYSLENIVAYRDIQLFKKNPKAIAPMELYKKYFSGADALLEVNTSKTNCQEVLKSIQSEDYNQDLFNSVEKDIIGNLTDTYARFIYSQLWIDYENSKKETLELLEGGNVLNEKK